MLKDIGAKKSMNNECCFHEGIPPYDGEVCIECVLTLKDESV